VVNVAIDDKVEEEYHKRFSDWDITQLIKNNVPKKQANSYGERFNGDEISSLVKANCSEEEADEYIRRFDGHDITELFKADCLHEEAAKYSFDFKTWEVIELAKEKIPPEVANNYTATKLNIEESRFDGKHIPKLIEEKIPLEQIQAYDPRFDPISIYWLHKCGCQPEIANQYQKTYQFGFQIAFLYSVEIDPEEAKNLFFSEMRDMIDRFSMVQMMLKEPIFDVKEKKGVYQLLGSGNNAFVLLNKEKKSAYKVSDNMGEEINLLKKIQRNQKPKNVITLKQKEIQDSGIKGLDIIELEYVKGQNLSKILDQEKIRYDTEQTINYSAGIFNGLCELRQAGIYHWDLWLGNVMVDEIRDRTVIIDLGTATTTNEKKMECNRRYGGENDLQSLGQIMYKMATGEHLFNPTVDKSTHLIPEEVKLEREKVYNDPETLQTRLEQVDQNVGDKNIAEIIKTCLTAKGTDQDYKRLEERFRDVN
jgi:hypothetical protein